MSPSLVHATADSQTPGHIMPRLSVKLGSEAVAVADPDVSLSPEALTPSPGPICVTLVRLVLSKVHCGKQKTAAKRGTQQDSQDVLHFLGPMQLLPPP